MSRVPKRAIVIGMDGAIPQWCERMIGEGKLENLARLIRRGSLFYALCPYPTVTASNWTTLSTGAWPGRHQVTHYDVHHPGQPLNRTSSGFDTRECAAEHIWSAAEKAGKRSVLIKYETAWPPTLKNGVVIDGCGPNYQDEFRRILPGRQSGFCLTTAPEPLATVVNLRRSGDRLLGEFTLETQHGEQKRYSLAIERSGGAPTAILSGPARELGRVAEGELSERITDSFRMDGRTVECFFQLLALKLPRDERDEMRIVSTSIFPKTGWTHPDSLGAELLEQVGPYVPRAFWEARVMSWVGDEEFVASMDRQHDWLGRAAQHLLAKEAWDLCYIQTHAQDYGHHLYLRAADPPAPGVISSDDEARSKRCLDRIYESADRMLGQVLEAVDDDTLVIVVSDHGAVTWKQGVSVDGILREAGLQVVTKDPDSGAETINWSKTKAVGQRGSYVYLNVKGRDPDGIVEPGDEYERVREQVIGALHDHEDPATGARTFSLVLRREDARMLGLYGDRVGDVVYALREGYGHEHGSQLPTGRLQNGSLESLLVLAGPGIKSGYRDAQAMVNIVDVVPTICYLLDIPFPSGCQGALIYDAFEDPGLKVSEKVKLESDLGKWRDACEKLSHITHNPQP